MARRSARARGQRFAVGGDPPSAGVADQRQDVLGLGQQEVLPEEPALAEDADEGVEHLGAVQRGELPGAVGPGHQVVGESAEVDEGRLGVGGAGGAGC